MNRVALAAAVAFGLATGAPGAARPLTFGAINGTDDLSQSSDLGGCASAPEIGSGAQTCALKRKAFGELSVSRGTVSLDAMGRARSVVIGLSARDYDRALQLLIGRYGRSVFEGGAAVWRGYDARAQIALQRSASGVQVRFDYPANGAVASTTPDPRLAGGRLRSSSGAQAPCPRALSVHARDAGTKDTRRRRLPSLTEGRNKGAGHFAPASLPSLRPKGLVCSDSYAAFFRCRRPSSSAICTAFSAAPLRRLSETTHMARPLSMVGSSRTRLT